MTDPLRTLVVGYGLIGRQRARSITKLGEELPVELAGVVDPVLKEAPDGVRWYRDLNEVPSESFDTAVVSVPHNVANDVALDVLAMGKPILVEKPLGTGLEKAREIAEAAKNPGGLSFVGYNYRFLPAVQASLGAISDGRLGTLRSVDMLIGHGGHPDSAKGWKLDAELAGGGVLLDPGVHLIDLMLLIDPDIKCTHAAATGGFWGTGIEEDLAATFQRDQLLIMMRVSHIRWINTFRIEFVGEDGYAITEGRGGNYGSQTLRIGKRWAWRNSEGLSQRETEEIQEFGSEDRSLELELAAVIRRWLGQVNGCEQQHPATMSEALEVARICDEIYSSMVGQGAFLR